MPDCGRGYEQWKEDLLDLEFNRVYDNNNDNDIDSDYDNYYDYGYDEYNEFDDIMTEVEQAELFIEQYGCPGRFPF